MRSPRRGALTIRSRTLEEILGRAEASAPEECCGILLGSESGPGQTCVERAVPAENVEVGQRERSYRIAPLAILAASREASAAGLEIVGYYHSHPSGSARPSDLDREQAWPETSYVILGVGGGGPATVRSWRLDAAGDLAEERVDRC